MEGRRGTDNHGVRNVAGPHTLDKVVERLAESALRVGHSDERVGLVVEDSFSSRDEGIDDGDNSEASLQPVLETSRLATC